MKPYDIRRLVGYSALIFVVALMLAGCASVFDSNEHARLVTIHVAAVDDSVCSDRERAAPVARQMYHDSRWVWHYSQYLANNEDMTKMGFELMQITRELHDRYEKTPTVSAFYCRSKFENIRRASETIIKVSARRARS